jgi:hypothetical protein
MFPGVSIQDMICIYLSKHIIKWRKLQQHLLYVHLWSYLLLHSLAGWAASIYTKSVIMFQSNQIKSKQGKTRQNKGEQSND